MFDGTLGKYTGSDYTIELQENAKTYHVKLYHANPFLIPNIQKPYYNFILARIIIDITYMFQAGTSRAIEL